jgi:release factor glutamine methyltransferase
MIAKDVLDKSIEFLKKKGFETARLDSELLLSGALNWNRIDLYLKFDCILTDQEIEKCREYIKRRSGGEPVAYILGFKDFYKSRFTVSKNVLIPRPETEELVEKAVEFLKQEKFRENAPQVLDLGTGSGCIGLSILSEIPNAHLVALDISPGALEVAEQNGLALGLGDRVKWLLNDASFFAEKMGLNSFDLIVANPPYISHDDPGVEKNVKDFEPHQALFASENGMAMVSTWVKTATHLVALGGQVLFEVGHDQGEKARSCFIETQKYSHVEILKDFSNKDRIIKAIRSNS